MGLPTHLAATGHPRGASGSSWCFELPAASLRVFHRTVATVTKLGRDAALILRSDELVLHGADDGHSAAMQFAFRRRLFKSTPASRGLTVVPPGVAGFEANSNGSGAATARSEVRVVVAARALLLALRGAQTRTVDNLIIGLSVANENEPRLVLEFAARFGGTVRHRVPLLDCEAFLPGEPGAGPHVAALTANLLSRVLDHCSPPSRGVGGGCDEVTLSAVPQEGLRIRSCDLLGSDGGSNGVGGGAQANRTEVIVQQSDLEACHLGSSGAEAIFSGRGLRDFAKSAEVCVRDLEAMGFLDGCPLLELRFGGAGGNSSVVCRMAVVNEGVVRPMTDFDGVLIVATRELAGADGDYGVGTQAPALPGAPGSSSVSGGMQATQGAAPNGRRQARQGAKRRALSTTASMEAFGAFPEHQPCASQGPWPSRTQVGTQLPAALSRSGPPAMPAEPATVQAQPSAIAALAMAPRGTMPGGGVTAPGISFASPAAPVSAAALAQSVPAHAVHFPPPTPVPGPTAMSAAAGPVSAADFAAAAAPATVFVPSASPPHAPAFSPSAPTQSTAFLHTAPALSQAFAPATQAATTAWRQTAVQPASTFAARAVVGASFAQPQPRQHQSLSVWGSTAADGASRPTPIFASQLAKSALDVPDSDDELIGADPDEVVFGGVEEPPVPRSGEDSVDWFDVERLW
eukprot:TRINITY_DN74294_c0_g1_i1.p1 TRINITY_DN74294_c0_g1~~TRINITY_DN74294_c0_g1_i1.p1  ORF type:complete len:688 (-),score=141.62 TRINITY_DN74294_c0_g1_i1:35-2098(-)